MVKEVLFRSSLHVVSGRSCRSCCFVSYRFRGGQAYYRKPSILRQQCNSSMIRTSKLASLNKMVNFDFITTSAKKGNKSWGLYNRGDAINAVH